MTSRFKTQRKQEKYALKKKKELKINSVISRTIRHVKMNVSLAAS